MFQISFYVPETHLEEVKNAMFQVGAGRLGNYDACAWQCLGEGQFRPLMGSDPYVGTQNFIEKVREYKVEMICEDSNIQTAITALKNSHPYETPAYNVIRLENF